MSFLTGLPSIKQALKWSGVNLVTPFYHAVSDDELPHIWPLYDVPTISDFNNHLDFLLKHFEFISASELNDVVADGGKSKGRPKAFLSFDDGLLECYEVIMPILLEKGIPATFFVNPSFVDNEDIFYRYKVSLMIDYIQKNQLSENKAGELKEILIDIGRLNYTLEDSLLSLKYSDVNSINDILRLLNINYRNSVIYMSSKMIFDLKNNGFNVGAHSMDHPLFSDLDLHEKLRQANESLIYCKKTLNEELNLFAFPFYDYDLSKEVYEKMYADLNVDLSFGTSGIKKDIFDKNIQRLPMEVDFDDVEDYIKEKLLYYRLKKIVGKHIMSRP